MKYLLIFIITFALYACKSRTNTSTNLQAQIDSLQKKLDNTYKPGLGEFMSNIQTHHAKLWFAGKNKNWELADFEIHEIEETLADIKEYCADRPETKSIDVLDIPIDSISNAIQQKNIAQFKSSYTLLTNTCNSCHQASNHGFNVIKIPDYPPFSNQDFKVKQ